MDPLSLKNYRLPDKYGNWLGYRVLALDRKTGTAKLGLTLREDHLSPAGRIHGGVVSGFFDFACGAAVFSTMGPEDFCSTVELKVNYFYPLDAGDKLTCRARPVFRGKRLCVVHALLYRNQQKQPVAMATGTFNIVSVSTRGKITALRAPSGPQLPDHLPRQAGESPPNPSSVKPPRGSFAPFARSGQARPVNTRPLLRRT